MEVGETVLALYLIDSKFDLAEGMVFIFLEVGEGYFEYSAFQGVVGVFETGSSIDECFPDTVCCN